MLPRHKSPSYLADVRDGDPGIAAALVAFSRDNLVVVIAVDIQPGLAPGIKVAAGLHGAAGALVNADRPVLIKGTGAVDTRFVYTRALAEPIRAAVTGHRAQIAGVG